jgi:hypothetical protein
LHPSEFLGQHQSAECGLSFSGINGFLSAYLAKNSALVSSKPALPSKLAVCFRKGHLLQSKKLEMGAESTLKKFYVIGNAIKFQIQIQMALVEQ